MDPPGVGGGRGLDEWLHLTPLHHVEHPREVGEEHPALQGLPEEEQGEEHGKHRVEEAVEVEADALGFGELLSAQMLEDPGVAGHGRRVGEV